MKNTIHNGIYRDSSVVVSACVSAGKTVCRELVRFPSVLMVAVYYACIRKRGVYDVIVCSHIGDFLFTVGYLQALDQKLKKERGAAYKRLRLVADRKFEKLLCFYPGLDCEYLAWKPRSLAAVLAANRSRSGRAFLYKLHSVSVVEPAAAFTDGVSYAFRDPGLSLRGCIQYGALGLGPDADLIRPSLPYGIRQKPGKRALLCPFAQVLETVQIKAYMDALAEWLLNSGYEVYANGAWSGMSEKIRVVYWELDRFFHNCFAIELVIGIRSGLLDLAACSSATVVALYPRGSSCSQYYDIRRIFPEKKNNYQYILTDDQDKDCKAIRKMAMPKQERKE